jgi:hypothetical protein
MASSGLSQYKLALDVLEEHFGPLVKVSRDGMDANIIGGRIGKRVGVEFSRTPHRMWPALCSGGPGSR